MYADDLILLSITIADLQLMLNVCTQVFSDLDLPINAAKSHCMRIGPRYNAACSSLDLQETALHWAESMTFLGVNICRASKFKCCWSEAKKKFFCNVNTILGRLGTAAPINVLLKLINSQGLQNLLYGTAATALSSADLKSLDYAYNGVFAKIFKISHPSCILQCQYYCGNLPFYITYEYQRFIFLRKLLLQGDLKTTCAVDAADLTDLRIIQSKYGFKTDDSINVLKRKSWLLFTNVIDSI